MHLNFFRFLIVAAEYEAEIKKYAGKNWRTVHIGLV